MLLKQKIDADIKHFISELLTTTKLQNIDEAEFNPNFHKVLLYPTDDLLLTDEQFQSLLKSKSGNQIYVMQIGYESNFLSDNNDVYILTAPYSYEEYKNLRFDTITILFSETRDWIVLIDESLEGGEGLFAGTIEMVEEFAHEYARIKEDVINFVNFQLQDFKDRNHVGALYHLQTMIDKLKK